MPKDDDVPVVAENSNASTVERSVVVGTLAVHNGSRLMLPCLPDLHAKKQHHRTREDPHRREAISVRDLW